MRLFCECQACTSPISACAQAMKTIEKVGLQAMAKKAGLDLLSLPYTDARPERLEWLAKQPGHPPQAKVCLGAYMRLWW